MKEPVSGKRNLSAQQLAELIGVLKARFEANMKRHQGLEWDKIEARLKARPDKAWSLQQMEATGGEPDVIGHDPAQNAHTWVDCSPESPAGRRSLCYDREGLESRKEHRPESSAMDRAAEMGIELLTEEEYLEFQKLGVFDTKTSSWLKTPDAVRKLGGALFGDRRYNRVFIYHNGAQSYYAARGFRGVLRF
jgi:hypothetical protein